MGVKEKHKRGKGGEHENKNKKNRKTQKQVQQKAQKYIHNSLNNTHKEKKQQKNGNKASKYYNDQYINKLQSASQISKRQSVTEAVSQPDQPSSQSPQTLVCHSHTVSIPLNQSNKQKFIKAVTQPRHLNTLLVA